MTIRDRLAQPATQQQLQDLFALASWVHFASVALIPPLPGDPSAPAVPSVMVELAVDEDRSPAQVRAALLESPLGAGIGQVLGINAAALADGLHVADGGFVGTRDRTASRIRQDVEAFLDIRRTWHPTVGASRAENAAATPGGPPGWRPEPVSLWRKPWMQMPLRALAIVFVLFASPLRAAGFGLSALFPACVVSAIVLALLVLAVIVALPPLLLSLLGLFAAAQAIALAVLSFWPYQGIVPIAFGALAASPLLFATAGTMIVAAFALFGWRALLGAALAGTAFVTAAFERIRTSLFPIFRDLLILGIPELVALLSPKPPAGGAIAWAVVAPVALALFAAGLVVAPLILLPFALFAAAGLLLARAFGSARPLALGVAAATVLLLGLAAWQHFAPFRITPATDWVGASVWALARVALAAVAAAMVLALTVLLFALAGRLAGRFQGLGALLALLAFLILALLVLPEPRSPPVDALIRPGPIALVSMLLVPAAVLLTIAAARYRQWDTAFVVMLAAGAVFAGLAALLAGLPAPIGVAEFRLAALVAAAAVLVWIRRLANVAPANLSRTLWPPVAVVLIGLAWLAVTAMWEFDPRIPVTRYPLLLAALLFIALAVDIRARAEIVAATIAGLAGAIAMAWLAARIPHGGSLARAAMVLAMLITASAMANGCLVFGRAMRSMAFGGSDARDLVAVLTGAALVILALLEFLVTLRFPAHALAEMLPAVARPSAWPVIGTWIAALAPHLPLVLLALLGTGTVYVTAICSVSLGALALVSIISIATWILAVALGATFLASTASALGLVDGSGATSVWFDQHWRASWLSSWLARHADDFSGLVARVVLPFTGLAVVYAGYLALRVPRRWLSEADAPGQGDIPRSRTLHRSIADCEARLAGKMQHMISVTEVRKPVWLFAPFLRLVLWTINCVGRIWCTEGRLGDPPGIHFGHWHVIDEGRRLVFCSNFEVPFGGYLDDFIRGTPNGANLIWQCTELRLRKPACDGQPGVEYPRAFPPTRLGVFGGCRNEQWFKAYARDSMVPHVFRYSAYDHTGDMIRRATDFLALRGALDPLAPTGAKEMNPVANDRILRALE